MTDFEMRQDKTGIFFQLFLVAGLYIFDKSPRRDWAMWIDSVTAFILPAYLYTGCIPSPYAQGSFVYLLLVCDLDFPEQL